MKIVIIHDDDDDDYQKDWGLLEDEEGQQLQKMSEHSEPLRGPLRIIMIIMIMIIIIISIMIINSSHSDGH